MRNVYLKYPSAFWIFSAFILWVVSFSGFLTSRLAIFEDAVSYYEHTRFFVENLRQGIFPLWDPFWFNGASNDFFLRRIGAFNPFYSIIVILQGIGVPYTYAYLSFLALYYWGGMIAFYLLMMRLYDNRLMAYAGYLMLMFSALGTRLFDSYMMLVTVPILWFFYFLVAFSQSPTRHSFLGCCLSFMILVGTYIPFYFLMFLILFVVLFLIFYSKDIRSLLQTYIAFIKKDTGIVLVSLILVCASFVPLYVFFHHSANGQIAMPIRHGSLATSQPLAVAQKTIDWGAVEDIVFSVYFSDLSTYRFAIIYVPFFAVVLFVLGLFGRISRRAVFLFVTGFVLFCAIIPHGLPFYEFLHKHLFFMKYFRNLHFFLWFVLIPLFVLLVIEHWKIFDSLKIAERTKRVYVLVIHAAALCFVVLRSEVLISTYIMLALSAVFWFLYVSHKLKNESLAALVLSAAILVQPFEVYSYLSGRAEPFKQGAYTYDVAGRPLSLTQPAPVQRASAAVKGPLYYAAASYNNVYENTDQYALDSYLQHKFIMVDKLEVLDRRQVDFNLINSHFLSRANKAFIFTSSVGKVKTIGNNPQPSVDAQYIFKEDETFRILSFNANKVELGVNIPYEKFLVYNDAYDSSWKVRVNGRSAALYQANIGFKGVWLPAGRSVVEFHYGYWWQYVMNLGLLSGAFLLLIGIIAGAAAAWINRRVK